MDVLLQQLNFIYLMEWKPKQVLVLQIVIVMVRKLKQYNKFFPTITDLLLLKML